MKYFKNVVPSVLLIILLIGFPQISETIYTPALPDIASSLMTSSSLVQWTLSVYFIGFALGVFYWGRCSDHIGRRPVMLLGLIIYGLGSVLCLFSQSIEWLLLARVLQAFGASVGSVITMTIIRESFHDIARQKLFSVIGIALSLSPALGPFIGGYVNDWFGWRANFSVLVIMSIMLFIYCLCSLPETKPQSNNGSKPVKISELALVLFRDPKILGSSWIVAAVNGVLFSYYAEAPFIFIKIIGITPGEYGWLGIFIMSASMFGSYLSHQLSDKCSKDQIVYLGCLITIISALVMSIFALLNLIDGNHIIRSTLFIMLPMAGIILGSCGLVLPVILSHALSSYKAVLGTAGALFGLSYYLLIAGLTWLMGILHSGTSLPMPLYFTVLSCSIFPAYYFLVREKVEI